MFHTLDDYKDKSKTTNKDNRKTTDSYTGGKSSGIAVENPDDHRKDDKEGFNKTKNKITLTVYKNGFIIDDGKFRPLTTPENQKFMDEVNKGYIPNELVRKGYKELGIALNDHKTEDYVEPVPEKKFEAFQGKGQSLGGISVSTQDIKVNTNVKSNLDTSKPSCKITVRLANGQIINGEFNVSQTLRDVFIFVSRSSGINTFRLLNGFPPRPITEMGKTIEELGIQGSMLTQSAN